VTLRTHLQPVMSLPPATNLRIAIAPFRDARVPASRENARPPLRFALLGVEVSGDYATGDASFSGDLAQFAREDAAATLAHSGLFAGVDTLPAAAPGAGASAIPAAPGAGASAIPAAAPGAGASAIPAAAPGAGASGQVAADLVLYGEVEDVVGIQTRRFEINLLRLPPLRNRLETPIGVARILYRLVDPSGAVRFEKRIETQISGRGLDAEQAALDALAETSEQLAQDLYRVLAPSPEPRVVPLLVLDACGLGEKRVRRLIEDASEVFEREVQVRLQPELSTWARPGSAQAPSDVLEAVKRIEPARDGLLLALVPSREVRRRVLRREPFGLAAQLGEHAVVTCGSDASLRTVTVIHEIGHLFGAVHVTERSSIMYPVAEFDARFFDDWNRRILRAARGRRFGHPVSAALRSELRTLYESAASASGTTVTDLQSALSAVRP
jgi:hypothetical protein